MGRRSALFRLAAAAALAAAPGCSPDNGLNMGRVYGTITYEGEPLESGQVLFTPDDTKGTVGVPAMAKIGADGTYELSTQEPGDGAIVGFHKVGVRGLDNDPVGGATEEPKTGKDVFASRVKGMKTARKKKPKATAEGATFTVNGKTYKLSTPEKLANPLESGVVVEVTRGSNRIDLAIAQDGTVKVGH